MLVKIIKSSKPSYWYADKINNIYEVSVFNDQCYIIEEVKRGDVGVYFIWADDCEVTKL